MHKSPQEMKTIALEDIESFLDRMVVLEKEHRRMRRTLLNLRKGFDHSPGEYLVEEMTLKEANKIVELIDKGLRRGE